LSKIIVITGAGVGLGRALARRFHADGDTVILLGRTPAKVEAVADALGERAMAVGCDVSSPDSVRGAFAAIAARYPKIDVLINNAAVYEPIMIAEATDEQILSTIGINLTGPILCARSAIPMMGPGGHIINVSSESVDLPFPHLILYQSSKAGLEQFTKRLQVELEPNGIRVSTVRAGQMIDPDKTMAFDPVRGARFYEAALAAGLNLGKRPISHVDSVTPIFRALLDLPPDVHAIGICVHARAAG